MAVTTKKSAEVGTSPHGCSQSSSARSAGRIQVTALLNGSSVFPASSTRPRAAGPSTPTRKLIEVDRGNHFAAWQVPDLFTTEVRVAFRPLRNGRSS